MFPEGKRMTKTIKKKEMKLSGLGWALRSTVGNVKHNMMCRLFSIITVKVCQVNLNVF